MSIYIRAKRGDGEAFLVLSKHNQPTDSEEIRTAIKNALSAIDGFYGNGSSDEKWRGDLILEIAMKSPGP